MKFTTRFAPSPTGPLHLGHAYSAMLAYDMVRSAAGEFLLRIEDIDQTRARPAWEDAIFADLRWLGLDWPQPVLRQSARLDRYAAAIDQLAGLGLVYPCSCNRADIRAAAGAPQEGVPRFGPDGQIYPGTCRGRPMASRRPGDVLRLDLGRALRRQPALTFTETGPSRTGIHRPDPLVLRNNIGDIILQRRGMGGSYHLAVAVDDADQNITHVIRGADLFDATAIHVLLQALLGLPTPVYHHHRLIRDEAGKRLAKRDDASAIAAYRAAGVSPADIRALTGLPPPISSG